MPDIQEAPDLWDLIEADWFYRVMPARTIGERISGTPKTIHLRKSGDTWDIHLEPDGIMPTASGLASLAEAKKKGNALLELAYESQAADMARSAGVDPAKWLYIDGEQPGFVFNNVERDREIFAVPGEDGKVEWFASVTPAVGADAVVYPDGFDNAVAAGNFAIGQDPEFRPNALAPSP